MVLVAWLGNELVAPYDEILFPRDVGYISRFAVKPEVQNIGVGKALMCAIEKK